jgi:hypothetical protein
LQKSCTELHTIKYKESELCLNINGKDFQLHNLGEYFKKFTGKKILVDATSTSVAELYLISKHVFLSKNIDFEIIYVEPEEYIKSDDNEFLLSDSGRGFMDNGIPSLTFPFDIDEKKHVIFLLGYEGDRFADAIESFQLKSENISLIIGVPSFKLNWEKNSILGNLKVIVDNGLNDRFIYCGANNPSGVAREIEKIKSFGDVGQLFIVPIGTKPQAIGCIPAICQNTIEECSGLMWDHPIRKKGRTKGVSKIQITKRLFENA